MQHACYRTPDNTELMNFFEDFRKEKKTAHVYTWKIRKNNLVHRNCVITTSKKEQIFFFMLAKNERKKHITINFNNTCYCDKTDYVRICKTDTQICLNVFFGCFNLLPILLWNLIPSRFLWETDQRAPTKRNSKNLIYCPTQAFFRPDEQGKQLYRRENITKMQWWCLC